MIGAALLARDAGSLTPRIGFCYFLIIKGAINMVSINFEGAKQFYASQPDKAAAQAAFDTLVNSTGAGNDFIGWVDLPVNRQEEFVPFRLRQRRSWSDSALVVIGIGGSYLGARAVVELLKSPNYNAFLPKKDP